MAETWFDTRTGDLLVGRDAAADRIDEAGPDIVPLQELLLAENFMYAAADLNKYSALNRGLSREDFVNFGQWTLKVINEEQPDTPEPLTYKILSRLHLLGLGPSYESYRLRGLGIASLSQEINYKPERLPGRNFEKWRNTDFANYADWISNKVEGKPTPQDYANLAERYPKSPALSDIRERMGSITALNERLGFPDIRIWEEEDYISYGVKIVEENSTDLLRKDIVDILSAKGRGPDFNTIQERFGWETYKQSVLEQLQEKIQIREEKLTRYRHMINEGLLPERYKDIDDDLLLQYGARYLLITNFSSTARWNTKRKFTAIESTQGNFIARATVSNSDLKAPLELKAEVLGVQDEIWPPPSHHGWLQVTSKELEASRNPQTPPN